MKIAVIGPTFPYKGGISHFTTSLIDNLRKIHNVDFISWKRQYPAFLYPVPLKDTESKYQIKTKAEFALDFLNPITWIKSTIKFRNKKYDLLILSWVSPVQAPIYFIIALLTKMFTATKILYICHNVLPHERSFYDRPLSKLVLSLGDSFIVHSKEDKKILESLVKNKRIISGFLPLFDMFPKAQKYNVSKIKEDLNLKNNVLFFFGFIREYKGLKYAIKAMPEILRSLPNTSLLVVGEFWPKDRDAYFNLIKNLMLDNHIIFIDRYVPNEEVGKYFAVSDVAVLPYTSSTQSAIVQTAYAFNKPVISTSVGGLKESILEGKTGYFVKPKDPKDIAEKVKLFYKKPISAENIMKYKERWSWDKYIKLIWESKN